MRNEGIRNIAFAPCDQRDKVLLNVTLEDSSLLRVMFPKAYYNSSFVHLAQENAEVSTTSPAFSGKNMMEIARRAIQCVCG